VFVARLPIDIKPGATLQIGDDVKDFRLSLDRGAFLVNEGKLFITGSRLEAWNEAARGPAVFRDKHDFRPFLVSWAGSETYIVDSVVAHLGFAATKAYGVSISQFSPKLAPVFKRPRPTGWLLNSEFFDNWYGFYCYEADDVVIRGNNYHDNIKYGIDPHDRSRRLIIAENRASGTKEKHGIIVSREVNDSWIFDNKSFENGLSGIVVDRSSVNNVVAHNQVYRNHADGITIYESPNTLLWQNLVVGNERHGIRVRNSVDADLRDNVAIGNGLSGIYGHIKNLNETDRNIHLDPFSQEISMTIVGGQLVSNGSGPVTIDQPLSLELYDVDLRRPARDLGIRLTGVLGQYQEQVLDILVRRKLPVVVRPAGGAASEASG
jgi:poly(beta-D-mannuronate) C5 epimerase